VSLEREREREREQELSVVQADSIDHLLADWDVTFIKMDVEGSELRALHGAEHTIISKRPRLAICVYHKPEDLITIPQYIRSLLPEARFYLRSHTYGIVDKVLYVIP
jgi:hypothetical protein